MWIATPIVNRGRHRQSNLNRGSFPVMVRKASLTDTDEPIK